MKKLSTLFLLFCVYFCGHAQQNSQDAFIEHMRKTQKLISVPLADYCIENVPDMANSYKNSKKNYLLVMDNALIEWSSKLPVEAYNIKDAEKELAFVKSLTEDILEKIKKIPAKGYCQGLITKWNQVTKEGALQEFSNSYKIYEKK